MKHIHLIGIGGSGISSIARVLLERGYTVSGSDRVLSPLARDLIALGVTVFEGHSADNIKGADMVIRSSAIADDNIEVLAAKKLEIPVQKRADFLSSLMLDNIGIAVAGTHGKTTTTAMMAWSLYRMGMDPSYILGGVSKNLGHNAHAGKGEYFVIEADEYDHMFLGLNPGVILLTNVDYDHPDCYPTIEAYVTAFKYFIRRLKPGGLLITNADNPASAALGKEVGFGSNVFTYGMGEDADYQAIDLKTNQIGGMTFSVQYGQDKQSLTTVSLQIPGEHNVRNALGVIAVHHQMGNQVRRAAQTLSDFKGTGRRFDVVGEVNGITIIDDYAHHPAKIRATLAAARSRYPGRRLIAVWQPHTYSRTHALEKEFIREIQAADLILVTEIYAAREPAEDYSARQLVEKMKTSRAHFIPTLDEMHEFLVDQLLPGDVLIVLSAGDADQICRSVFNELKERKG